MFTGLIIKESLHDLAVLDGLKVTKTEEWNISNPSAGQSPVWHVVTVEVEDVNMDNLAQHFSEALKRGKWYIDLSSDLEKVVIYPEKVFRYRKGDAAREEAMQYGRDLGIPEEQLDWKE